MATFQVTLKDGRTYEVSARDGATEAEVYGYAMQAAESEPKPPVNTAKDVGLSAAYAIPKAVAGILGSPGDILGLINRGAEWGMSKKYGGKPEDYRQPGLQDYVGSEQFRKPMESVTGKFYEPQTRAGKATDTAIQTASMFGRNLAKNPAQSAKLIAAITTGTEGAGALTNDNPWARLVGGVLGGGLPAATNAVKSRAGTVVKDALGDVTDAKIADAIARQQRARAQGVPLMGTESLDTGHQLASAVYASPKGNAVIDPFVRQRSAQTSAAVNRDIINPTGSVESAQEAAARAQRAATSVIDKAEGARTRATTPFYNAAKTESVPWKNIEDAKASITSHLDEYPKSVSPQQRAEIEQYLAKLGAPESKTASFLDDIYRQARNSAEAPAIGATAEQKNVAAAMGPVARALKQASDFGSLKIGRDTHQAFTKNLVDPLTSGPVGAVAGRTGYVPGEQATVPRVVGTIANENVTSPREIRTLYTHLNGADPKAFPGIAKTYFSQQLNNATTKIRPGENPTAGAKFYDAIAGNQSQRENFNEIMRGVAIANGKNPDDVVAGANRLLETLERTGRTPGVGSQTQPRGEVTRELGRTKTGDIMNTVSGQPLGPMSDRINSWILRGRYDDLARVLTAPDSVEQLVKMAKLKPNGTTAQFYAASMLGLMRANATDQ